MTTDRFDDELLSDVLDGRADEQTTAAVQADPAARARLARLRTVQQMVATPPPPADSERRAQSIAAALAEARTAPEIASLAPARQARVERRRVPTQWIAVAAAAVVLVLAVPFLATLGGNDDDAADFATGAADTADSGSSQGLSANDERMAEEEAEAAELSGDADLDTAGDDGGGVVGSDAAATEAAPQAGDDAGDDGVDPAAEADADDAVATTTTVAAARTIQSVSNTAVLLSFIEAGIIQPQFVSTDPEVVLNIAAGCLEPFTGDTTESFGLARLTQPDGTERFVLIHFGADATTVLDGEDCSPIG